MASEARYRYLKPEAAKRLIDDLHSEGLDYDQDIAAIEAEAVAARNAEIAEAVRELRCPNSEHGPYGSAYRDGWYQAQAADLAIIEKP